MHGHQVNTLTGQCDARHKQNVVLYPKNGFVFVSVQSLSLCSLTHCQLQLTTIVMHVTVMNATYITALCHEKVVSHTCHAHS